jgi:hypothetical protein
VTDHVDLPPGEFKNGFLVDSQAEFILFQEFPGLVEPFSFLSFAVGLVENVLGVVHKFLVGALRCILAGFSVQGRKTRAWMVFGTSHK